MRILALDLATKTGWAHSSGPSGVQSFALRRGDSSGMRFVYLRAWLTRMEENEPFDLIAYEQPHHRGGRATEVLLGLATTVQGWAAENGKEVTTRSTSELKKHATGKGKASKLSMMLSAERKFGREPEDDNEADAMWLLDLVKRETEGS